MCLLINLFQLPLGFYFHLSSNIFFQYLQRFFLITSRDVKYKPLLLIVLLRMKDAIGKEKSDT